jgi:Putative transposase
MSRIAGFGSSWCFFLSGFGCSGAGFEAEAVIAGLKDLAVAGIRRFLLHVLPKGFHRIRHYGFLASSARKANIALARQLLDVATPPDDAEAVEPVDVRPPCPCCGGHMIIIETFERWQQPRAPPMGPAPTRELVS